MTEISVKDQIKKIVELQKIDSEIYELKTQLKDKPAVIEQLKAEFESKKEGLNALEEKLKSIQVERKEKELELKTFEDEITKANAQLSEIKTNKEYSAKIAEIEHSKADQSRAEEMILESYEEQDTINAEIEKEKTVVSEQEKDYLAKKKVAEDDVKEIKDRIKVLESQRQQITPGIDGEILSRYERILERKSGLALVPVTGTSCGGCHMNVTPQQINAIKLNKEIVACEMCNRILYLED